MFSQIINIDPWPIHGSSRLLNYTQSMMSQRQDDASHSFLIFIFLGTSYWFEFHFTLISVCVFCPSPSERNQFCFLLLSCHVAVSSVVIESDMMFMYLYFFLYTVICVVEKYLYWIESYRITDRNISGYEITQKKEEKVRRISGTS